VTPTYGSRRSLGKSTFDSVRARAESPIRSG
jgi:hypothetical protein